MNCFYWKPYNCTVVQGVSTVGIGMMFFSLSNSFLVVRFVFYKETLFSFYVDE